VPVGALNRMWILGSLQAKIAVSYISNWLRSGFVDKVERDRRLTETHIKAALKLLGGMGYLRGAIMKVGQILANYPDVVPEQFADILGRLHFEAPPMHFSLLRELVRSELGSDPEKIFDHFETEAFAAASLGQVHKARLKGSGKVVAVKVQYPNIARTIRDDFRNMKALIFPMRLSNDWDNLMDQFDDIRHMLDLEVDYENEAKNLEIGRAGFTEEDNIVVPKVYPEFSSKRVLTMDFIEGVHMDDYIATNPSVEEKDRYGLLICNSTFRLAYKCMMLHSDPHPGNYLFMPDGRLGFIDFGCCRNYTQEEKKYVAMSEEAVQGNQENLVEMIRQAGDLTPGQQADEKRIALYKKWCYWVWEPLAKDELFDFGDRDYFKRGMEIYGELMRRRYIRSRPTNTWLAKCFFGIRALLARLEARVNFREAWKRETWVEVL